jgi:hypothetical protein
VNQSQLEKLLSSSFQYLSVPELKLIPAKIISKFKAVPTRFLEKFVHRPHLLDGLPLKIKQQVSPRQDIAPVCCEQKA